MTQISTPEVTNLTHRVAETRGSNRCTGNTPNWRSVRCLVCAITAAGSFTLLQIPNLANTPAAVQLPFLAPQDSTAPTTSKLADYEHHAPEHADVGTPRRPPDGKHHANIYERNGNNYSGDMLNGRYDGNGILSFTTGAVFNGIFRDGMMKNGTMNNPGKGWYTGEFRNNKRSGAGVYTAASGAWWHDGQWDNDQGNGYGTLEHPGKGRYTGEFRNNKRSGAGVYTAASGAWWHDGQWDNDQKNGRGIGLDEFKITRTGIWRENTLEKLLKLNLDDTTNRNPPGSIPIMIQTGFSGINEAILKTVFVSFQSSVTDNNDGLRLRQEVPFTVLVQRGSHHTGKYIAESKTAVITLTGTWFDPISIQNTTLKAIIGETNLRLFQRTLVHEYAHFLEGLLTVEEHRKLETLYVNYKDDSKLPIYCKNNPTELFAVTCSEAFSCDRSVTKPEMTRRSLEAEFREIYEFCSGLPFSHGRVPELPNVEEHPSFTPNFCSNT
jgi:hypothetical protein